MAKNTNSFSRVLSALALSFMVALSGCYDDSALQAQLNDHESRLKELERICSQANTNIEALQTIVSALQERDYVTGVAPIKEGDKVLGYTITFSKSGAVTIYHGRDGQNGSNGTNGDNGIDGIDGHTPVISVKRDADDIWYWVIDGEWLLDSDGNKVKAVGVDGQNGSNGSNGSNGIDGVTPKLKIENGHWYVSYDGGETYAPESLGQATGDKGDSMFEEVTYDEDYLYITMSDGQQLVLPRTSVSSDEESLKLATISLDNITATTVEFSGHINVTASNLSFSQVTIYYSDAEIFNINDAQRASTTAFDSNLNFTITLTNLKYNTKYNYCIYVKVKSEENYSDVNTVTTTGPVAPLGYIDLSAVSSANCYIISQSGNYSLVVASGNEWSPSLYFATETASVLWESFGTTTMPNVGDLIKSIFYKDGYISFQTADTFKEGNAVIAAKDISGTILWSWHIWFTDQPHGQAYHNSAGIMMDRNLGATSATPGDVAALGLFYQWGRKDPFLGSSSISSDTVAESTIAWPSAVSSNSLTGTIAYSVANPTTFITYNNRDWDWYYTGTSIDNTRWSTSEASKTIYDPCPSGWRVPDGGEYGVWSKAVGSDYIQYPPYDSTNEGMNFSGEFGSDQTIWYPASGFRDSFDGGLYGVGYCGLYCSASPINEDVDELRFYGDGRGVSPTFNYSRARGYSIRCVQE